MALSKTIFQPFVTPLAIYVVPVLEKIQASFFSSKIKHDTLCNGYKDGGLKNADILKNVYMSSVFMNKKGL